MPPAPESSPQAGSDVAPLTQEPATSPESQPPWLRLTCNERIGSHTVRHNIALSQPWTCIFGPSGSGKSTLLRLVAGLTPQRTGTCAVHGRELRSLPAHRRHGALVEQSPALFPHRNVERNVAFACPAAPDQHEVREALLTDFQLIPLRRKSIHTLSGGERQRVAIARALCSQPRALLLDEVFTGMDAALRTELIAVLQRYRERLGMPILSVTHDIGEALATSNEVLRIHDGEIIAQGTPAQVLSVERKDLLTRLTRDNA